MPMDAHPTHTKKVVVLFLEYSLQAYCDFASSRILCSPVPHLVECRTRHWKFAGNCKNALIAIISGMGSQVCVVLRDITLPDYPAFFLTSFLARVLLKNCALMIKVPCESERYKRVQISRCRVYVFEKLDQRLMHRDNALFSGLFSDIGSKYSATIYFNPSWPHCNS